ncbi:MAG: T9SS type A sorting domain-containing protein [Ignavibacteria bacterium]|nr:T9SS type A sorting domain-containing protein [Ignavibacteria bacterium]
MTGFQEIVNQNPYSYEGLIAGWDYSATSLLSGGQGGGEKNLEPGTSNPESENPRLRIFTDDPYDKYDSKRFKKEDRKAIRENVINSFQTSRDIEIEKVKSLEKKVREGNAAKKERSELKVKKILSEVIKIKKPGDITEHINNVNSNIQKVFGAVNDQNSNDIINIIPTEYSLSQNYPNPFNPSTKINFSLPEDGKIKLIVYDILGREVKRLINSEFRSAGRYTVEFNGAGLSSGVYFYKLEAGEFVQTKRMVLIK